MFEVEAWDTNGPQHIPRLYSEQEVADREQALRHRIADLEARAMRAEGVRPVGP